jgi:type II secretory pathway component PulJ
MELRRGTGEEGVTLVELIVVLVLLSIVSIMLFGFMSNTTEISARVDDHNTAERDAILGMRRITQDLRGANPVVTNGSNVPICPSAYSALAAGNCVEVLLSRNTNLSSATFCVVSGRSVALPFRRVVFRLEGSRVLENRYEHTSSCTTAASSSLDRSVVEEVANPATTRLFTFLNRSGDPITPGQSIGNAGSVRISLVLAYRAGTAPLQLSSVAALRNYRS